MSAATPSACDAHPVDAWQHSLANVVRNVDTLLGMLGLEAAAVDAVAAASTGFALRVPREYVARMRHGDPHDPLLAQVLPRGAERVATAGFVTDPLAETDAEDGVLHKYHGRMLLVTTGACAVHCRYCFRRHFPYAEQQALRGEWHAALAAVAADHDVRELIISGGDPLTLSDRRLGTLLDGLAGIDHLRRLRIHTRLPVVIPSRLTDALLARINATGRPWTLVIHANHAQEIDASVRAALARARAAGAVLLNQAVLLRGVNDTVAAQAALCEALGDAGVVPYYLHLLDPVAGAAHFATDEADALALMRALRARLPGWLVPRLAREIPGEPAKTVLA